MEETLSTIGVVICCAASVIVGGLALRQPPQTALQIPATVFARDLVDRQAVDRRWAAWVSHVQRGRELLEEEVPAE